MRISKKQWAALGGLKNSRCYRSADKRGRWRYYLAAALVVALAGCQRSPVVAGDFACTLDGGDTLLIEDVAAATALHSGAWRVDVEAGFYLYALRAGELCAVLP